MKDKLLELYKKHEEIVNYIIVGVMTTIFSWWYMRLVYGPFWIRKIR